MGQGGGSPHGITPSLRDYEISTSRHLLWWNFPGHPHEATIQGGLQGTVTKRARKRTGGSSQEYTWDQCCHSVPGPTELRSSAHWVPALCTQVHLDLSSHPLQHSCKGTRWALTLMKHYRLTYRHWRPRCHIHPLWFLLHRRHHFFVILQTSAHLSPLRGRETGHSQLYFLLFLHTSGVFYGIVHLMAW